MFTWDNNKAISNYEKHGVSFEEAVTAFIDPDGLHFNDPKHSQEEERYLRLAKSVDDKILLVVYTIRRLSNGQETIRIISARQASQKERKTYARFKN